jgi:hypothetical protein
MKIIKKVGGVFWDFHMLLAGWAFLYIAHMLVVTHMYPRYHCGLIDSMKQVQQCEQYYQKQKQQFLSDKTHY